MRPITALIALSAASLLLCPPAARASWDDWEAPENVARPSAPALLAHVPANAPSASAAGPGR